MKYETAPKSDHYLVEVGDLPNAIFFQLCEAEYEYNCVAVDLDLSDGVFVNSVHVFDDNTNKAGEEINLNYNQKYELQKAFEWAFEENARESEEFFLGDSVERPFVDCRINPNM